MYERKVTSPPSIPPPPLGTVPATRQPGDVRVGDYLYLDGAYRRVQDMRSAGTAGPRVLIFTGHHPLVMRKATTTFRPVESP